ncbi:MAG: hypothetical protein ACRDRY_10865 [Pseudonocardiaceae bacterium]
MLRPPAYDAPSALAIYDHNSQSLFSSDCCGTVLPTLVEDAADASESDYLDGMRLFTRANAPWTALVDEHKFDGAVTEIERLHPTRVLAPWLPDEDLSVEAVLARHELATPT